MLNKIIIHKFSKQVPQRVAQTTVVFGIDKPQDKPILRNRIVLSFLAFHKTGAINMCIGGITSIDVQALRSLVHPFLTLPHLPEGIAEVFC